MRINGSIQRTAAAQNQAAAVASRPTSASSSTATSSDRVQLSGVGAQVFQALHAHPSASIAELADAVSAGRYHPDPNAVSASIVQHAMSVAA